MRIKRSEERWFAFENDPDGAQVLIKHLSPGEIQDIADATLPQRIEYVQDSNGNLTPNYTIRPNRKAEREQTLVRAIKDWKKFYDEKGKVLKCNNSNIIRASREIAGFVEAVTEFRNILASDIAKEKEMQEKN